MTVTRILTTILGLCQKTDRIRAGEQRPAVLSLSSFIRKDDYIPFS